MKLLALIPLLFSTLAFGQAWSGIIAPNRAIDWTHAGATIPTVSTPCATQPSATLASVQSAFDADKGGGSYCVINIPAGTIDASAGTLVMQYAGKTNVILRGAGANATIFKWNTPPTNRCNGDQITYFCSRNGDSSGAGAWANTVNWTAGYAAGTTVLTLASVPNMKVGSQMVVYQTDTSSDNGNAWFAQTCGFNGAVSWQGSQSSPVDNCSAGAGATQFQEVEVVGCNGNTTYGTACPAGTSVTISPGIYLTTWNSGQNPKATWSSTLPISNLGIEDLEIDDASSTNGIFVEFHNGYNEWVNGIATIANPTSGSTTNHVIGWSSSHITAENSYFFGSYAGSGGYGVDFTRSGCDNLAQNNIAQHMDTAYITESSCGNVFGYDYAIDNYFGAAWQQDDNYQHSAGDYLNLREGMIGIGYNSDAIHGTHLFNTAFRSRFSGFDPTTYTGGKSQNQVAMGDAAYSRYDNWIGNVLGTVGHVSTYQLVPTTATQCTPGPNTPTIYEMGYSNSGQAFAVACGAAFTINNDIPSTPGASVISTFRGGNYDTVNGSVQWNSSENASTAPTYPGLASPSHTLPASFYLSGTPSWWTFPSGTTAPFPPIGPDVTGGNISGVGGFAWITPADNCYNNVFHGVTDGSPTPIPFNRTSCYPTGSPGLAQPIYSAGTGNYFVLPTVTFTCPAGATCGYTTDGSTPTGTSGTITHGTVYTSPVPITVSGTVLKSIATQSGHANSAETDATYTRTNILLDVHNKFDGGSGSVTSGSVVIGTPIAGDFITCEATLADVATITSVSDNVNAGNYLLAIAHDNTTIGSRTGIYYKFNAASAPTTVTITLSGASTFVGLPCQAWKLISSGTVTLDSGFLQQQDQTGTASPNPNTGTAISPSAANELVLSSVITNSLTPGAGTNFTATDFAGGAGIYPQYWIQTTATSTNSPYSMGSDAWTDMQTAFEFTPGGSSAAPSGVSVFVIGIQ